MIRSTNPIVANAIAAANAKHGDTFLDKRGRKTTVGDIVALETKRGNKFEVVDWRENSDLITVKDIERSGRLLQITRKALVNVTT